MSHWLWTGLPSNATKWSVACVVIKTTMKSSKIKSEGCDNKIDYIAIETEMTT